MSLLLVGRNSYNSWKRGFQWSEAWLLMGGNDASNKWNRKGLRVWLYGFLSVLPTRLVAPMAPVGHTSRQR